MDAPGRLMLKVWIFCIFFWVILPFQLVNKELPIYGIIIFIIFIFAFWIGTHAKGSQFKYIERDKNWSQKDIKKAQIILSFVSFISCILLLIEFRNRDILDLAGSYQLRSDQADAILQGSSISNSSIVFQLAFLSYPAAYIVLAMEIVYKEKINFVKLLLTCLCPIVLATLVMGGRAPLFYGIFIAFFSWQTRKNYSFSFKYASKAKTNNNWKKFVYISILILVVVIAFYYFSVVFFVRADIVGGSEGMFIIAEETWGVKFTGMFAKLFFDFLGKDVSFLIFIFSWYTLQGFVMSIQIFDGYNGPMQLGTYGVDLASALIRRINGGWLASNYDHLIKLNTYGFFSSAFGSLYIDFKFWGILISFLWGWWCKSVYLKVYSNNTRSFVLHPFMITGILFSFINTPIGFTNGLITHVWLFIGYFCIKSTNKNLPTSI
jgi:oligosaccharide repeat unit polymerase